MNSPVTTKIFNSTLRTSSVSHPRPRTEEKVSRLTNGLCQELGLCIMYLIALVLRSICVSPRSKDTDQFSAAGQHEPHNINPKSPHLEGLPDGSRVRLKPK